MRFLPAAIFVIVVVSAVGYGEVLPRASGTFSQQVSVAYTDGLPDQDVKRIAVAGDGRVYADTAAGPARLVDGRFDALDAGGLPAEVASVFRPAGSSSIHLANLPVGGDRVRDRAESGGEIALATSDGLFVGDGATWEMILPREGEVRWAPLDVRVVAYDDAGQLWFGCPQGVGYRIGEGQWKLFTGAEGLPFNDFTCMATGTTGVWFGTTNGAIRYFDGTWEFRGGRRWVAGDAIRDIAIDRRGNAWLATDGGVSCIEFRPMTLAEKAAYY